MRVTSLFIFNEDAPFSITDLFKTILALLVGPYTRKHVIVIANRFENQINPTPRFTISTEYNAMNHALTTRLISQSLTYVVLTKSRDCKKAMRG